MDSRSWVDFDLLSKMSVNSRYLRTADGRSRREVVDVADRGGTPQILRRGRC